MTATMDEIEGDLRVLERQPMLPLVTVFATRVIDHCRALADRVAFLEAERRSGEGRRGGD